MTCTGCVAAAKFVKDAGVTEVNPVVDVDFWEQEWTNPNGTCTGTPCKQAAPCSPVGWLTVTNCWPVPVEVKRRMFPGGNTWAWWHLGCGTGLPIWMEGVSVDCGKDLLMAEVWDQSQEPARKLGEVFFDCSACGEG